MNSAKVTHYNSHPSGIECIDVAKHHSFNIGNVFKYLWRAGLKSGETILSDLRKARYYMDREIEMLEAVANTRKVIDDVNKHNKLAPKATVRLNTVYRHTSTRCHYRVLEKVNYRDSMDNWVDGVIYKREGASSKGTIFVRTLDNFLENFKEVD